VSATLTRRGQHERGSRTEAGRRSRPRSREEGKKGGGEKGCRRSRFAECRVENKKKKKDARTLRLPNWVALCARQRKGRKGRKKKRRRENTIHHLESSRSEGGGLEEISLPFELGGGEGEERGKGERGVQIPLPL